MKQKIVERLKTIEHSESIKILLAVESGSRAWGFASSDSDWDVRFIYIQQADWYLSIDDKRDSLDYPADDLLDFSGWELRKTLRLFRKSNPPLLEWLRSPIIYLEQFITAERMRSLSAEYFNPRSCLHHYLHMASGNFREYLKGDYVPVKKYFYVLRPVLACQWIMKTNTMAPMEFDHLLETQIDDNLLKDAIEDLVNRKKSGDELDQEPKITVINDYLEERITFFEEQVKSFGPIIAPDTGKLDLLFRETLREAW